MNKAQRYSSTNDALGLKILGYSITFELHVRKYINVVILVYVYHDFARYNHLQMVYFQFCLQVSFHFFFPKDTFFFISSVSNVMTHLLSPGMSPHIYHLSPLISLVIDMVLIWEPGSHNFHHNSVYHILLLRCSTGHEL